MISLRDLARQVRRSPPAPPIERPRSRADCVDGPRPCPFVSCKHNLYLDVDRATGSVRLNQPGIQPWQMDPERSCALDVAERSGLTMEEVGQILSISRERVRQIEEAGIRKLEPTVSEMDGRKLPLPRDLLARLAKGRK